MRGPLRIVPAMLAGLLALAAALPARAWSVHTLCTAEAVAGMPEMAGRAPVRAESLEAFVAAQAPQLERLLAAHEAWARTHLADYPPRPDELAFGPGPRDTLVPRFLAALRLNSETRVKLYVQLRPGSDGADRPRLPWVDITALKSGSAARENTYLALGDGDAVAPLDVLASASNEPDYGLDIGLFADNGTAQGQRYGFGNQPFGSPSVDYSSQAPFHMAFFHEAGIVNAAAPFLRRTHPESRVALFGALARHAFATGHDYWGWRFAGWALHYVQDLTQPYHARVLPGVSTVRMLWINTLDLLGFHGSKADAINLVTNRHIVLENYQLRRVAAALVRGDRADPLLAALRGPADEPRLALGLDALRAVVSAEAADAADGLDELIERTFPARYVDDPSQPLGNEADLLDMSQLAQAAPAADRSAFERALALLLERYGRHTRAQLRALLAPP